MVDLRLDLGQLETLQTSLTRIAGEFDRADGAGGDVTAAVGTIGTLPYKVGAFAGAWIDTREGLGENLRSLATAVQTIRETFEDLDEMLATEAAELTPEMPS